ncbi:MAG TPA: acyl-CoA dehydrogenase family protein [Methylomirabilota bacterium]|jgi:alkylation response protein AidB-like acyl-CoA dehydrogenase|nr:acyl-CoA dehydrogenase family protein [Methylomirabilota bacterium]
MALDFELSDEQKLLQAATRELLKRFEPRRKEFRELMHAERRYPQELWDALAEMGFMGSLVPEEYGGSGLGLTGLVLGLEELASAGFGSSTLMVLTGMDALCILRNGSEALKRRFLPAIATGQLKLCFAITEPDAGSNSFRISTRAERQGDHYEITGSKVFITGVDATDYLLLVTRTTAYPQVRARQLPKAHGFSLFLVPTDAPGLEKRKLPMRGIEGHNQFLLFFDRVRVPAENLVGHEDRGAEALFNSLNPERILAAASSCGTVAWLLHRACEYARERKVFGDRPIGSYQGLAHPLAEARIELDAVRLLTYRAAWAFDRGAPPPVVGTYANMAKYMAAELGVKAADRAIETLGGYGFSEEYEIIHAWEGTRLLRTAPISREMILNYVAEHVLELPRSY